MDALQPFAKKNNVVENMKRAVSNAQKAVEEAAGQISQAVAEGVLSTRHLNVSAKGCVQVVLSASPRSKARCCWLGSS